MVLPVRNGLEEDGCGGYIYIYSWTKVGSCWNCLELDHDSTCTVKKFYFTSKIYETVVKKYHSEFIQCLKETDLVYSNIRIIYSP